MNLASYGDPAFTPTIIRNTIKSSTPVSGHRPSATFSISRACFMTALGGAVRGAGGGATS